MLLVNMFGGPGSGKAQPLTSKIKTPTGWITMKDVSIGDEILTPCGQKSNVVGVFPQGKKQIYTITFSDGRTARACGDHLWKCWYVPKIHNKEKQGYDKRSISEILTTKQIIDLINRPSLGGFKFNVSIPLIQQKINDSNASRLEIDPYILGVLLGDGGVTGQSVRFTLVDKEIVENVNSLCIKEAFKVASVSEKSYKEWYIHDLLSIRPGEPRMENRIKTILREFNLWDHYSYEKFIPEEYINASSYQKVRLLQGLFDTDGTVAKGGQCSYTSTSKQLAQQVQNLLWSLGCIASLSCRTPTYVHNDKKNSGRLAYTIRFNAIDKSIFFSLTRKKNRIKLTNEKSLRLKIISIKADSVEQAQCIKTKHRYGLYITDNYVVTHNTTAAHSVYGALKAQHKKVGYAREVAYDMIVAGRAHMLQDQIWMFAKQRRYLLDVCKDNDLVLTDCPLLLSSIYGAHESKSFQQLVLEEYLKHDNFNIFLNRPTENFSEYGRVHNLQQSIDFDNKMKELLVYHNQPYTEVKVDGKTTETILQLLNSRMK